MKLFSLIKAAFSQDMNLFKYKSKRNSSKLSKIIMPIILFLLVCISVGGYALPMAQILHDVNLTYIVISMFVFAVTAFTFFEGIYKSQGILFEARDNDLLFSLPIKKSYILFTRILKMLTFQFLFNLMILLPAFVAYAIYEKPGVYFYIIALVILILTPIIPTILSSTIGYLVKIVSSRFKSKKTVQTALSFIIVIAIIYISFGTNSFMEGLAERATSINELLTKIYYPLGLISNLIIRFNLMDFIKLLLINIIPLLLFILIGAKFYYKMISATGEHANRKKKTNKKEEIKARKPIIALTKKEIKRYFSSPVYMVNTGTGLILVLLATIFLCVKGSNFFESFMAENQIDLMGISINIMFYALVLFMAGLTSISSSSISLEGKTINITKSLPISEKTIFKSKILACFVIEMPFLLISDLLFIIFFGVNIWFSLLLIALSFIIVFMNACIGLNINLKYPKMDATNDTEVVKQSMSSFVSVFIGMIISMVSCGLVFSLCTMNIVPSEIVILLNLAILLFISLISYLKLMKKGVKKYREINV